METLLKQFLDVRTQTEKICNPLKIEDYIPQPESFVSPPKWHLGHTTWFFEKMVLRQFSPTYKPFNLEYDFIFNSYYETVGKHLLRTNRGNLSRPTVEETYAYRKYVNTAMKNFLSQEQELKIKNIVILGLNHEQQHQELLLTDIKYILACNPLLPKYKEKGIEETINQGDGSWVHIPEGVYEVGFKGEGFCYDNELNRHKTYIQECEIQDHLVTNGEFIEFIKDDGYKKPRLWHSNAWKWIKEHHIEHPLYWTKKENEYWFFTLGGLTKINPQAQLIHVNYYEAYAFARWKEMRLPTEFEWEVAQNKLHWGSRWEWTESAYLPYPGYKQAEDASGEYNGKFMVSQKVLRGGSVGTAAGHTRSTYRNYFYPHENWQFTGFRLAK